MDDITEWLDPPPLKRASQLGNIAQESKARRLEDELPAFLRNQSVEGLETRAKCEVNSGRAFCRHASVPDDDRDTDSSDDDVTEISDWYRNVSTFRKIDVEPTKNILAGIAKKGEQLLGKKSYDVAEAHSRNQQSDKQVEDCVYSADCLKTNCPKIDRDKKAAKSVDSQNKSNFFTKTLLSPKLSRLFKPNTGEVLRSKQSCDDKEEKSKSKFFVQRPGSPGRAAYRVRPLDEKHRHNPKESNVIKTDLKLAALGKPMTPIFRRHNASAEYADGRFSYRDKRHNCDGKPDKHLEFRRKPVLSTDAKPAPLVRSAPSGNLTALATVLEKDREKSLTPDSAKKQPAISRSNYVSLANLRINGRPKGLGKQDKSRHGLDDLSPLERVI